MGLCLLYIQVFCVLLRFANVKKIDKIKSAAEKHLQRSKETLKNKIDCFVDGENWLGRCITAKNHDEHLLRRPGYNRRHSIIH